MTANHLLLFGDPDWVGALILLVLFSLIVGGFVFTVFVICRNVFGGRASASYLTINPETAEARTDERR